MLICVAPSFAQKEYNVWHFGQFAGLDFNTDPPTPFAGPLDTDEGSATICDAITGSLLFSSDGSRILNRKGEPIKGFEPLDPNDFGTSTQAALIIPFLKDINKYFVFFADQCGYIGPNKGIRYVIVDMRGDDGFGEVITKPIIVFPNDMTEKLTAIPHENGCDIWLLAHRQLSNEYLATLIHDSSVSAQPVTTAIGHVPESTTGSNEGGIGWLVASHQGDRIAYVSYEGVIELLKFDRSSGRLSDLLSIPTPSGGYGACFSPDGSRLYTSNAADGGFAQYDLTVPVDQIGSTAVRFGSYAGGAIRSGPNGKLYCVSFATQWLHAINEPNAKGLACGFEDHAVKFDGGGSLWGLPNIPDAFIGKSTRPCLGPPVSILADRTTICAGECVQLTAIDHNDRSLIWHTSDAREVVGQTATSLCFDVAGSYEVELFALNGTSDTVKTKITLTVLPVVESSMRSFTIWTDTIGATVKVPIVLSTVIDGNFEARFKYRSDLLEFVGAFDSAGRKIDISVKDGLIDISAGIAHDSIVGYLYFDLFWENDPCRTIELVSSSVSGNDRRCLNTNATTLEVCLQDYCGERTISEYMRDSSVSLRAVYAPHENAVNLLTSHDLPDASIQLIDANGKIVVTQQISLVAGSPISLDASKLPQGIYFLTVRNGFAGSRASVTVFR